MEWPGPAQILLSLQKPLRVSFQNRLFSLQMCVVSKFQMVDFGWRIKSFRIGIFVKSHLDTKQQWSSVPSEGPSMVGWGFLCHLGRKPK